MRFAPASTTMSVVGVLLHEVVTVGGNSLTLIYRRSGGCVAAGLP